MNIRNTTNSFYTMSSFDESKKIHPDPTVGKTCKCDECITLEFYNEWKDSNVKRIRDMCQERPRLYSADELTTCGTCRKTRLCPKHTARAARNRGMCDTCCWFEIS